MSDLNYWIIFLSTAFALNIAPGPDLLYILTKTIANGKKVGIAASLGVCTGALFHVFLAAFGLSAIIASSAIAFTIVKVIGACYLLYLAYQSFRSSGTNLDILVADTSEETPFSAFKQGVLIDVLNPKVAIFFMAFLPQFIRNDHGSIPLQLLYLGLIIVIVAIVVEVIYVLIVSKLTEKIRGSQKISMWLDRVVGTIFLGLGIKLATSTST